MPSSHNLSLVATGSFLDWHARYVIDADTEFPTSWVGFRDAGGLFFPGFMAHKLDGPLFLMLWHKGLTSLIPP